MLGATMPGWLFVDPSQMILAMIFWVVGGVLQGAFWYFVVYRGGMLAIRLTVRYWREVWAIAAFGALIVLGFAAVP